MVSWPEGSRAAISCYFNNGAATMQDGKVVLFPLTYRNLQGDQDAPRTIETTVTDCRMMRHSSEGRFVIVVGKSEACVISTAEAKLLANVDLSDLSDPEPAFSKDGRWLAFNAAHQVRIFDLARMAWHGEPLQFDDRLLLSTPLPDSLLTVEESGRVRQTSLVDGKSEIIHEFQAAKLTAATFCSRPRRLVLATTDASVLIFQMP